METIKSITFYTLVLFITLFISCNGNKQTTLNGKLLTAYKEKLVGVPSVTVEINGVQTTADEEGSFTIKVNRSKSYIINIDTKGYAPIHEVRRNLPETHRWILFPSTVIEVDPTQPIAATVSSPFNNWWCQGTLRSQIDWAYYPNWKTNVIDGSGNQIGTEYPPELMNPVQNSQKGTICGLGISISIPANSIVDSDGNAITSPVSIDLAQFDLYSPTSMAGDYRVQTADGIRTMQSFGAGSIKIYDANQEYNLKKGTSASITIPVDQTVTNNIESMPESVPFLTYDKKSALWIPTSEAKFDKELNAYIADIDHLSVFNMDLVRTDQSCLHLVATYTENFNIEIIIPLGDGTFKTKTFMNQPPGVHVIANLPNNTYVNILTTEYDSNLPLEDITVSTAGPQNPVEPDIPDGPPYTACQVTVQLGDGPVQIAVPIIDEMIQESLTSIKVTWQYNDHPNVRHYLIQLDDNQDFNSPLEQQYAIIMIGGPPPNTTFTGLSNGTYYTRVKAIKTDGTQTGWSPIRNTTISTDPPTELRIVNNLYSGMEGTTNWGQLNNIVRVRIGPSENAVLNSNAYEVLNPFETVGDVSQTKQITPGNSMNFDVSAYADASEYWVVIQTGWWDLDVIFCDPPCWVLHPSNVIYCDGLTVGQKYSTIKVFPPYGDPEEIVASNFMACRNYPETVFCNDPTAGGPDNCY